MHPDENVAQQFAVERYRRWSWRKPKQGRPKELTYRWFEFFNGRWRQSHYNNIRLHDDLREFLNDLINQKRLDDVGTDTSEERITRIMERLPKLLSAK